MRNPHNTIEQLVENGWNREQATNLVIAIRTALIFLWAAPPVLILIAIGYFIV